jgi:hypothetical protein
MAGKRAKPKANGDLNSALRAFMAHNGMDDAEIDAILAKPVVPRPPRKHTKRGKPRRDECLGVPGPPRARTERPRKP